ncbi:RAVE protein 1 C terminal-domain-containing protein [Dipodascopsis tothii]|uniref:RAVE protein 1 C terminal-domain-containing protein n=1 Tax=Dipodascopsis tothii TaxID=44089 RepID=UPI0034CE1F0A
MSSIDIHAGKPNPIHQAQSTAYWNDCRVYAYTSGNNLVIFSSLRVPCQTIYLDRDGGAVDIEESSGRIAVVIGSKVQVYQPSLSIKKPKWTLEWTLPLDRDDGIPSGVNWGNDEELFISGKTISLWTFFKDGPHRLWKKHLALPAMMSAFSYDAYLAATVGSNDRLVKVWRRFSYDVSNVDFDFSYLPHPRAVTNIRWRRPFSNAQSVDNILYTFCSDGVLRIWAPTDGSETSYMQMWASLDLFDVLPRNFPDEKRYAFIVDNKDFTRATESAVRHSKDGTLSDKKMQNLIEVAARNPDICIVFDERGRMAVVGIENIGSRVKKSLSIFDISYNDTPLDRFPEGTDHIGMLGFGATTQSEPDFTLIMHDFAGVIKCYVARFEDILYPGDLEQRLSLKNVWTGHNKSIQRFVRTADGKALLSSSSHAENIVWQHKVEHNYATIYPRSIIMAPDYVRSAVILSKGAYVVTIQSYEIVLWSCSQPTAKRIAGVALGDFDSKKILNLVLIPEQSLCRYHVLALGVTNDGVVWEINLPDSSERSIPGSPQPLADPAAFQSNIWPTFANGSFSDKTVTRYHSTKSAYLKEFARFKLPIPEDDVLKHAIAVDPVGWNATLSNTFDQFTRDVLTTISSSGTVRSWTVKVSDQDRSVSWLQTASVETGIHSVVLAKASSMKKLAIVDSRSLRLTIWDIREQHLEYEEQFEALNTIQDLDWICSPDSQSILSVGFPSKVNLYCQLRFDYTKELPAWSSFREISVTPFTTRSIADSIWLDDGTLVIGSGNQLFIVDKKIDSASADKVQHLLPHKIPLGNIFDVVSVLNGPLPLYHPQLLTQSVFAGKSNQARNILTNLLRELRFKVIGDSKVADIESSLGFDIEQFLSQSTEEEPKSRKQKYSQLFASNSGDDDILSDFSLDVARRLVEFLTQVSLPYLTSHQQISLVSIIEGLGQVEEHRSSLDENGTRYLLAFRLFILHRETQLQMPYRDFNWALHSTSQEILTDLVQRAYPSGLTWTQASECGIFMWLKDVDSAKRQLENIARNTYASTESRDPIDCSLYYLALRKKQVLLSLWRIAHTHKDQRTMMKFLSNDFSDPRWKTAALKNAYVLLSKQRYAYAAAFFLLGDSLKDAVNVCLRNLGDIQLAVTIARIYEGDGGLTFTNLIDREILPMAFQRGDRWLASWAFYMKNERTAAVKCILPEFFKEMSAAEATNELQNKMFLVEDPVLVVLYRQLRDSLDLERSWEITPAMENDFVLHIAKLYDRMGCDVLALDLVKNWAFFNKGTRRPKSEQIAKSVSPVELKQPVEAKPTYSMAAMEESSLLMNWM